MKIIKYFFQASLIFIFFTVCKLIGYKLSSNLGSLIGATIGPFLRSKNLLQNNIKKAFSNIEKVEIDHISKNMWKNYGRILAEYVFIKHFRNSNFKKYISIEGEEILLNIKRNKDPVIFVSGHFNNFELMAMVIQKEGVNLGAIYRPLNNFFLNKTMEKIRIKHICKIQIKKGLSGIREILNLFKKNVSIALMIDQRVTEGIKANFFNKEAFTTTIPAQLVKKFNCPVVSIYIERIEKYNFRLIINKPIYFAKDESLKQITEKLNYILEKMVLKNPEQWILTHNRWKL